MLFSYHYIQLFFKVAKMLSWVHCKCKCANAPSLTLGCASCVMEMWIFSVASGSQGSDSHPAMLKLLNNIISSLSYAYGLMLPKTLLFHFIFMFLFEITQPF